MNIRVGNLSFGICKNILNRDWSQMKFISFDAPEHKGDYSERFRFLEASVPQNEHLKVAPVTICKDRLQLISLLEGLFFEISSYILRYDQSRRRRADH